MTRTSAELAYLCDVNIWLALTLSGHGHHERARGWLDTVDEPASVLFCRATQQSFLRLLTNPAVLAPYGDPPLTNVEAWAVYDALAADERVALAVEEPLGLEAQWKAYASRSTASPKLWMDAYLAAFALTGGHQMITTDVAFGQFDQLALMLLR